MIVRLIKRLQLFYRARVVPEAGLYLCRRYGMRFRLHVDRYVDRQIAVCGTFEPATTELFRRIIGKGCYVLDVGANIGWFTLHAASLVGRNGRVIACEPTSHFRQDLEGHILVNGFKEIVVVNPIALSDSSGFVTMNVNKNSATIHKLDGAAEAIGTERIQTQTLDALHACGDIPRVQLIKIDVDGHETAILAGAKDYLAKCSPVIVIEFAQWCLDEAGSSAEGLRDFLFELGYILYSEKTGRSFVGRLDFLAECGNWDHAANVWAIPKKMAANLASLNDFRIQAGHG